MDPLQGTEGAPGGEGCLQGLVQGAEFATDEDLDSSDENLWERVLKIVADRDVRRSGSQREGELGKDMGAPMSASGEKEA